MKATSAAVTVVALPLGGLATTTRTWCVVVAAAAATAGSVGAADGSVRDGLSMLDQAIAHGGGVVDAAQVRDMLGLADRSRVIDLFEQVMKGDMPAVVSSLGEMHDSGADPVVILQDLLELTHWVTRLKVAPEAAAGGVTTHVRRLLPLDAPP